MNFDSIFVGLLGFFWLLRKCEENERIRNGK
jgi:hypothetical protein